jgi:hypothetical protein
LILASHSGFEPWLLIGQIEGQIEASTGSTY